MLLAPADCLYPLTIVVLSRTTMATRVVSRLFLSLEEIHIAQQEDLVGISGKFLFHKVHSLSKLPMVVLKVDMVQFMDIGLTDKTPVHIVQPKVKMGIMLLTKSPAFDMGLVVEFWYTTRMKIIWGVPMVELPAEEIIQQV